MTTYRATIDWRCDGDFATRRYSRVHTLGFDGGLTVPGTAGPANVNPRYSMEAALDPEQAFVASLSACHMLWFLDIAARAGFLVEAYRDPSAQAQHRETRHYQIWRDAVAPMMAEPRAGVKFAAIPVDDQPG